MGNDVLDSPKKRRAYQPFDYVINVTNTGTERLTDLDLVDEVEPQGPVFLDVSEQCVDATIYNPRNVACGILRLEPGETVTITMCAAEPVLINNTAELRGGEFFDILGSDSTVTEVVGDPTACPTDPDPGPDPGTFPGGGVGGDGQNDPADPDSTLVDVYAPSFEASQDADIDQDSGDVDQQTEGSPGGTQDANTGNFAAPYQDINW